MASRKHTSQFDATYADGIRVGFRGDGGLVIELDAHWALFLRKLAGKADLAAFFAAFFRQFKVNENGKDRATQGQ